MVRTKGDRVPTKGRSNDRAIAYTYIRYLFLTRINICINVTFLQLAVPRHPGKLPVVLLLAVKVAAAKVSFALDSYDRIS